jgi:serine/threonine protein kinase
MTDQSGRESDSRSSDGQGPSADPTSAPTSDSQSVSSSDLPPGVPRRIARYEIRRVIASGGMGTVFEALQDQPRRSVAIKVMKHGVVSPASLRRFEIESQLLAKLRHPSIAQVYEAGTFDDGSGSVPFFAMEYIPNAKPLTEYAREKGLTVRERLQLFAEVCDAVHHGHQRGVIHRDLKPSNILIDASGRPRIIDFGVARSLDAELVQASIQTEHGQLVGTLHYMSPEQFDVDPGDVDTRSDVYALGVVLFELLAGYLPYPVDQSAIYEAARVVREQPPSKLGQRNPALAGEIETVVSKALEKDRDRRYQSAHGLAQDLRRYLSGEAISARPPSVRYQMSVFARRNKTLIGAMAAVFAVLVIGMAVSASLFFKASSERARAELETERALAASNFLTEILAEALPRGYGEEATVQLLLDESSKKVETAFPHDPELEAEIRLTLGSAYRRIGNEVEAREQVERAYELRAANLGEDDPVTLETLHGLAHIYIVWGHNQELLEATSRLLEIENRSYGPDDDRTIATRAEHVYALEANARLREAAETAKENYEICKQKYAEDSSETLAALGQYTWLLFKRGEFESAESQARRAYELARTGHGEGQEATREAKSLLAAILIAQDRIDESKELYQGRPLPADMGIELVFQGSFDRELEGTQVLIFWETCCPFSQRTIPSMERIHQRYRDQGLEVIGLTRVTRSSTDQKVREFVSENRITYPILKDSGAAWSYFDCEGTPWITVVQDGAMIWEMDIDTPENFPDEILQKLVGAGRGSS